MAEKTELNNNNENEQRKKETFREKIDRKLNGWDLMKREKLWAERGIRIKKSDIKSDKRIGVDYAKHCKEYLWRFQTKTE